MNKAKTVAAALRALAEDLEAGTDEPVTDKFQRGDIVQVRDDDNETWRTRTYHRHDSLHTHQHRISFDPTGAEDKCGWKQCQPHPDYHSITIWKRNKGVPPDYEGWISIKRRNGQIDTMHSSLLPPNKWELNGYPTDIVGWAEA